MSYFIELKSPADYENLNGVLAPGMLVSLHYRVGTDMEKHYDNLTFEKVHICPDSSGCGLSGHCYYKTIRFTDKRRRFHGMCVTHALNRIEIINGAQINKITEI